MSVEFDTSVQQLDHLNISYLYIPKEIVDRFGGISKTRLLCTVNGKVTFQGGFVALGEGAAYININKKRLKEAGAVPGDTVHLLLLPDKSEYGMQVPEELAEVLRQDPEGEERFKSLTPGKRRYVIFYVASVKSPQLRIDRALLLITNLRKLQRGKETLRDMIHSSR